MRSSTLRCLLVLLLGTNSWSWNGAGHRAIAFIAYSHLTPSAKQRVNLIFVAHPDFETILKEGATGDPEDILRDAFVTAATWPDIIRGDDRFVGDPKGTTPDPGFPDMGKHTNWHFINIPIPAAFASQPIDPENAQSQIPALAANLHRAGAVRMEEAYALPWLLHLVGDLHQPLHSVARFRLVNNQARGDLGGNNCFVRGSRNLHSLWDGLLGAEEGDRFIARLAASLQDAVPQPATVSLDPRVWTAEGVALAQQTVYAFNGDCSDRNRPVLLTDQYRVAARRSARVRAAMAGFRLAALLNRQLGN